MTDDCCFHVETFGRCFWPVRKGCFDVFDAIDV